MSSFDQFKGDEILPERSFQDYQSQYIDLYQAYRPKVDGDKENINDDIVFEMELIRQEEINIDYILMLVAKYHQSNCKDKEILGTIDRAIDGICSQTYYKWQKRLFTMAKAQHEVQFAEVTPITETPLRQQAAISIHIAGATVDIHSGADTATVEMILRILKSC